MKLLHPFMPFITEEIYCNLINEDESIMISSWPVYTEENNYPEAEKEMEMFMDIVRSIRNIKAEMNVPPSRKPKVIFVSKDNKNREIIRNAELFIRTLAGASGIEIRNDKQGIPVNAVTAVLEGVEIFVPLEELIDLEKEIERLEKEKTELEFELERVNRMLSNENFVAKAPQKVVEAEKAKKDKYTDMYNKVLERLAKLKK